MTIATLPQRLVHYSHRLRSGDLAYLRYRLWQYWHRLDFSGVDLATLGLSPDHAHPHYWSGGPDLRRVLDQLTIPPQSRIVDLGSGKGAACFTLAEYFAGVCGVELSPRLCTIARENARKLRRRSIFFVCADAATFDQYDGFTYAYCFNAFPESVLIAALAQIRASLARCPRPFTFIYKYPGTPRAEVFEGFSHRMYTVPESHPYHVYTTP